MVQRKPLKKNSPAVSIIMPAYNAEKYIEDAIESILNQTYRNFEFIIGDDCSTDKTWDIIKKFAEKDNRIIAFRNKKNLYIAGNRNALLRHAGGHFIAWQDADDISLPTRIERQYKFMKNHPDVGITGGYLQFFSGNKNYGIRKYDSGDRELRKKIFRYSPVAQPSSMIRRSCFDAVGYYDLKYPPAEDIDMSFRIGEKYKFANLPEVVLRYRESNDSATYKRVKFILRTTILIRKKYWNSMAYSPSTLDVFYNFLQSIILYLLPPRIIILIFNLYRNS